MQQADGSIVYKDKYGNTVEDKLFTYSESEKQRHEIDSENAKLVTATRYLTIPQEVFSELNLNGNEAIIYSFVDSWLATGGRFYFNNDDLAKKFNLSVTSISEILKRLSVKGLIHTSYKMKASGGEIRFIDLTASRNFKQRLQESLSSRFKKGEAYNKVLSINKKSNYKPSNGHPSKEGFETQIQDRSQEYLDKTGKWPTQTTKDKWLEKLKNGENIFM